MRLCDRHDLPWLTPRELFDRLLDYIIVPPDGLTGRAALALLDRLIRECAALDLPLAGPNAAERHELLANRMMDAKGARRWVLDYCQQRAFELGIDGKWVAIGHRNPGAGYEIIPPHYWAFLKLDIGSRTADSDEYGLLYTRLQFLFLEDLPQDTVFLNEIKIALRQAESLAENWALAPSAPTSAPQPSGDDTGRHEAGAVLTKHGDVIPADGGPTAPDGGASPQCRPSEQLQTQEPARQAGAAPILSTKKSKGGRKPGPYRDRLKRFLRWWDESRPNGLAGTSMSELCREARKRLAADKISKVPKSRSGLVDAIKTLIREIEAEKVDSAANAPETRR